MTKEYLAKKRDELAGDRVNEKYIERLLTKFPDVHIGSFGFGYGQGFKHGFDAAVALLWPEIEKAEKTGLQKAARIAELAASEFWHEQSTLMGDGAEMVKFRINHALAALEGKK